MAEFYEDEEDPQKALARSLTSTPTHVPGKVSQWRQKAYEQSQRALDLATTPPDMGQAVENYQQRYQGAGGDMAAGMALSTLGGRALAPFGGQVLTQALKARQPVSNKYGTIGPEGFTADPFAQRDMEIGRLEGQAKLFESMGLHEEAAQLREREIAERERQHQFNERLRQDQLRISGASQGLARERFEWEKQKEGNWQLKEVDGQPVLFNPRTQQVKPVNAGAGRPDVLPKSATAEEKNKYANATEMLARGRRLASEVEANPEAFGFVAGAAAQISNRTGVPVQKLVLTQEQEQLRAGVYQQSYEVINKLAGAALSAHEAGRIMQFAPGPRDSTETIVAKLKSAMTEAATQRQVLQQRFQMPPDEFTRDLKNDLIRTPSSGGLPRANLNNRVGNYLKEAGN